MIALLCAAICSGACSRKEESPPPERVSAARKAPRPISPRWVTTYDPALAWNGYTLTLHDLRIPVLLDMNGRPVHAWPRARIKSRVRLLPDGSILGIGLGRSVVEYDWEGRKTWEFRTENAFPHHDVIRLRNGNTLVLVLRAKEGADTLLEVDRKGKIVWTWKAIEHLGGLAPPPGAHKNDATHVNSIQELPENPWFAAGDNRFRPGNILASARNLNAVFLVDRATGAIVWSYRKDLDRQHEAEMNGPNLAAPGMIQIFNNRQRSFLAERRSEIVEIDPRDGSIAWHYKAPGFFTPTGGMQQALPNGNLLITSTRGGRVFEITRAGALAWEWVPPYEPVRAVRVARDACPQLARLHPAPLQAVHPPAGSHYVDRDVYRFARRGSRVDVVVDGTNRTVLEDESDCREILLPVGAEMTVGYGVDRKKLRAAGSADRSPVFTVHLRPAGSKADIVLFRDAVGLEGPAWRQRAIPLGAYGFRSVQLCVEIEGGAPKGTPVNERFAFWEQPDLSTALDRARAGDAPNPGDLTPEELEVQLKHLRSLGYVN